MYNWYPFSQIGFEEYDGDDGIDLPSGKRISMTVNGKTFYYFYDSLDRIMDFDSNGNIIARYTHNPAIIDEPINMQTSTGTYYYLFDGLGSVTGLTDNGGNLVST